MTTRQRTTTYNLLAALVVAAISLVGCGGSAPEGPVRGSAEWYSQTATEAYTAGDYVKALEELEYAADGEGEWAQRAVIWRGLVTAGLGRGNQAVAEVGRIAMEENIDLVGLVRTPMQQAQRDARQNIIGFVEELGSFQTALGSGDIVLDLPFPPGSQTDSAAMSALENGEPIAENRLEGGVRDYIGRGVVEVFAVMAGTGDDLAKAQAAFEAGPVTVSGAAGKLAVATLLTDMSPAFSKAQMNDAKVREAILQRADQWIESGLESEDEEVKARAERLRDIIEDERRDIKGLVRLHADD